MEIASKQITPEEGRRLMKLLSDQEESKTSLKEKKNTGNPKDIAIIGISGRFPDADDVYQFWDNISSGKDSITKVPLERWDTDQYYDPAGATENKTSSKWGAFLSDIESFDAMFFKISPKEVALMDPQQRIFLEEAWKALEDAGYPPDTLSGTKCGVFAGVLPNWYEQNLKKNNHIVSNFLTGTGSSYLPARISYFLNLKGPNMAIDTACSSSLVAIHQACQSIYFGESEMAIAGGVSVITSPDLYIMASEGGMLSRDGKCKTFDNEADGFVPGEAAGIVILKPLSKAIEDKDYIYGVIKGSGVNQDGKTNGLTAPSSLSQMELEMDVYQSNNINPAQISYVEAHGTGTKLGDPIEISALTKAFESYTEKKQFCAIGSVKTNVGHTLAAAGVIGLIKILLCLKYKAIAPSLNYKTENEHLNLKNSPFYVNTRLKEWRSENGFPRVAAINSFGLSGTNCHMVIQEPPIL